MKRLITLKGPELTGFGFVNVAGFLTFVQMCLGMTNCRLRVEEMNCESGVFRLMATPYLPFALTEAMLLSSPVSPTRSMILSCLPAFRL